MALQALGLALAAVVLFLAAVAGLEFVEARYDQWRTRRALRRYAEASERARPEWPDPPRSAGRY